MADIRPLQAEYFQAVVDLHEARGIVEHGNEMRKQLLEQLHNSREWKEAESLVESGDAAVKLADGQVRKLAVELFKATGDKVLPGCTVGESTSLVYDKQAAIDWCVEKRFTGALSLKKSDFEKLAAAAKPEFVLFEPAFKLAVRSDLGEAIAELREAVTGG